MPVQWFGIPVAPGFLVYAGKTKVCRVRFHGVRRRIDGVLQQLFRFFRPIQLQQGHALTVSGFRYKALVPVAVGFEVPKNIECFQRALALQVDAAKPTRCIREAFAAGVFLDNLHEMQDGILILIAFFEDRSEIIVGFRAQVFAASLLDEVKQPGEGFVRLPALQVYFSQPEPEFIDYRRFRILLGKFFEKRRSRFCVAGGKQGDLDAGCGIGDVGTAGILFEHDAIGGYGLFGTSGIEEAVPDTILRFRSQRVPGPGSEQRVVFLDGLIVILISEEEVAKAVAGFLGPLAARMKFQ